MLRNVPKLTTRATPAFFRTRPLIWLRQYSTQPTASSNALKKSPFAIPKDIKPVSEDAKPVPQEDIDDFKHTTLKHGNTNLEFAITTKARDKLYSIANADKSLTTALKIGVESGGCHGFQYNLKLTDLQQELAEDEDILVFERNDTRSTEYDVAQVILDESSLELLQESKVDYTKELIGSQFKVFDSPYTTAGCGCGSSFDFDFEKLQKKKEV